MAHPIMFSEEDPFLQRFRELAFSFPGAQEKIAHGRPVFYTKKVFAYYGMSHKVDGEWVDDSYRMTAPKKLVDELDDPLG